jgi:proline dehydrogenase
MLRFNRLSGIHTDNTPVQPLIYQTYQAYLRRTPSYLRQSLAFAKSHGFALGAKLVRSAYHPHEMAAHVARGGNSSPSISDDELPPVWASKEETDKSYNECVGVIVDAVAADVKASSSSTGGAGWISRLFGSTPSSTGKGEDRPPAVGVLFGTHNRASCGLLLSSLSARGLASPSPGHPGSLTIPPAVAGRVALAQLYGMHDALTNALVDGIRSEGGGPVVLKYVPYGGLKEVRSIICVALCLNGC